MPRQPILAVAIVLCTGVSLHPVPVSASDEFLPAPRSPSAGPIPTPSVAKVEPAPLSTLQEWGDLLPPPQVPGSGSWDIILDDAPRQPAPAASWEGTYCTGQFSSIRKVAHPSRPYMEWGGYTQCNRPQQILNQIALYKWVDNLSQGWQLVDSDPAECLCWIANSYPSTPCINANARYYRMVANAFIDGVRMVGIPAYSSSTLLTCGTRSR